MNTCVQNPFKFDAIHLANIENKYKRNFFFLDVETENFQFTVENFYSSQHSTYSKRRPTFLDQTNRLFSNDPKKYPRIVSICWKVLSSTMKIISQEYFLIRPPDNRAILLDYCNLTVSDLLQNGHDLSKILSKLRHEIWTTQPIIVGYNVYFDVNCINAHCNPADEIFRDESKLLCVQNFFTYIVKIRQFFKLQDAFKYLFERADSTFGDWHTANGDCEATRLIFLRLVFLLNKFSGPICLEHI